MGELDAGAVSLTLTSRATSTNRLLQPSGGKATISGALSFDGVASHSVSGTFDPSNDSINFTADGATYTGTLDSDLLPARMVGEMIALRPGDRSGILHCVLDDGAVAVHCGHWSWSPDRYLAPIGFLTRGKDVAGGVITLFSVAPFYGYHITGTVEDGDPLRPLTASGSTSLDSMALSGYVDTVIDTAGGTYDIIPLVPGTTAGGWWHTSVIDPYGIAVAHKHVP